jgi:hypothetical protein
LGILESCASDDAREGSESESQSESEEEKKQQEESESERPEEPAGANAKIEKLDKTEKVILREKHRKAYKAFILSDEAKFEEVSKRIQEAQSLEQLKQLSLDIVNAFVGCDIIAQESKNMLKALRSESSFGGYKQCPQKHCGEIRFIYDFDDGPLLEPCLCGDGEDTEEEDESEDDE